MKKTLLLAASFLALTSVTAFAEGPYIAGDLGIAIFHDSDIKPAGFATETAEFDSAFGFDIAVGFSLKENIRAEAEIGYRKADVDTVDGINVGGGNSLGVTSYMVNGYYDFTQLKLPVKPYVGLGLGFLDGKVKAPGFSESDTVFGYQLMLGVSLPINRNFSVNAGYKLQGTFNDFEVQGDEVSYSSSNLLLGARYNF